MILHVTTETEWTEYESKEYYFPLAYKQEKFIHACTEAQLSGVLERYFKGKANLLLLYIDADKLKASVQYERALNGEVFPHIYGVINKDSVIRIDRLPAV
jgi:uncharacterized protein (DUF952 family)